MTKKYNKGIPVNVPDNQKEREIAISEWAEGDKDMERVLTECINNRILTYASCSGEENTGLAYISMQITKENIRQIINIMNNVATIKGTAIKLSFNEMQGSILSIYSSIYKKDEVFNVIAENASKGIELEQSEKGIQEIVKMHEMLRIYGHEHKRMTTHIELYNETSIKAIRLRHNVGDYDNILKCQLSKSSFKQKDNMQKMNIYDLKNIDEMAQFNSDLLQSYNRNKCEMVKSDEFYDKFVNNPWFKEIQQKTTKNNNDFKERLKFNGIESTSSKIEIQPLEQRENLETMKGEEI